MYRSAHLESAIRFTRSAILAYREGRMLDCIACQDSAKWHLSFLTTRTV